MSIEDWDGPDFNGLIRLLKEYDRVALAFSGGADSSFLLAAFKTAGVSEILAVTLVSPFFTKREKERATALARDMGAEHLCLDLDILGNPEVVRNDAKRCYHCKRSGFGAIREAARERGMTRLVHGINTDDLGDFRPGIRAAEELGFEAPLAAAGFAKAQVRDFSKKMGLLTWDLPAQSCLATRVPLGERITKAALKRVEDAEDALHDLGFGRVRVRCHGDLARIETPKEDLGRMTGAGVRQKIVTALKTAGFRFAALDLEGYVRGKMNPEEKQRN